jgi:dsRNA-specific ribonuclease
MKNCLINNIHLYRIGMAKRLHKAMRTKDPEQKHFHPAFSHKAEQRLQFSCTGKNVADCVESLIGAYIMSNNLKSACQFISDLRLVPLEEAGLMDLFPDKCVQFEIPDRLEQFGIGKEESFNSCIQKFLAVRSYGFEADKRILRAISTEQPVGRVGMIYEDLWHRNARVKLGIDVLEEECLRKLETLQSDILGYQFNNPRTLLEAMTHKTMGPLGFRSNYEKLEILGDSILDYLVNYSLIKFTLLGKAMPLHERKRLFDEFFVTEEEF